MACIRIRSSCYRSSQRRRDKAHSFRRSFGAHAFISTLTSSAASTCISRRRPAWRRVALKEDRLRPLRSAQAVAAHQDGFVGHGHPVERCRFLPGPSEIRRGAGRGERQGFCRWRRYGVGGPHGGGGGSRPNSRRACTAAEPHFAMGGPMAADLTESRCASERGLAMGRGPRGAPLRTVAGSGKSVARCHRTVLAYWKFESISLQRGVSELSVPER